MKNVIKHFRSSLQWIFVLHLIVVDVQCISAQNHNSVDATSFVIRSFDDYDVVGIGESHWLQEQHDWIISLIKTPEFRVKTQHIVIEFANAFYQNLIDDYVLHLKPLDYKEIAVIWQNTCVSPFQTWDGYVYRRFFETVREINSQLPFEKRIRIIAGDAPINWTQVRSANDVTPYLTDRDRYAYSVIKKLLEHKNKFMIIYGSMHLFKNLVPNPELPITPPSFATNNIASYIQSEFPNRTIFFMVYVGNQNEGFKNEIEHIYEQLSKLQKNSIYILKDSPLANLSSDIFLPKPANNFPSPVIIKGGTLSNMADGILFFGKPQDLSACKANPEAIDDAEYHQMLNFRQQLYTKSNFNLQKLFKETIKPYSNAIWE